MTWNQFLVSRQKRSETRDFARREISARCETSHDIVSRYCIIQYFFTLFRLDIRNWDDTMIKTRWHDIEITMMRWHDRENNIAFSSSCHRSFIISYYRVLTIVTSSYTIVQSRFLLLSLRCFTIVQSLFHVRTIVFSPSHHRVFINVPL
jgi:hypothetical protein